MKVSFVVFEDENPGVEYISDYLKRHGHQVELVFNPNQFHKAYGRSEFLAKVFDWQEINLLELKKQDPDLVGFSCVTATYRNALNFAKRVKKGLNRPIIFGGTHPTLAPEAVMQNIEVDMVCVGEGEAPMLELAESLDRGVQRTDIRNLWFKENGRIIRNAVRPLEQIDQYRMDRSLFLSRLPSNYSRHAYFITSRGCPFTCSFCGNEQKRKIYKGNGRYVRQKTVDGAIEELQAFKNRFHPKRILFVDDVLAMDRTWFEEFMERYRREIDLPFTCFIHPRLFDEKLGMQLKEGGCRLAWFGIQTGSERVRKEILSRPETNADIRRTAQICRRIGLKFMVDHIFDIPADEDITQSIALYNEIRPDMINCYNLLYFPMSRILEHALEHGQLSLDEVGKINRGEALVYQTGNRQTGNRQTGNRTPERENYRKYALLLTCIPIFSRGMVDRIVKSPRWLECFGSLPPILIPLVKIFLNIRIGHGFIPAAVIRTELFWIIRFIMKSVRKKIGLL